MIAYLSGKVILQKEKFIILDVAGVGYKINKLATKELPLGSLVSFFIHQHIREESNDLYGFETIERMELFEQLISVNGVGPKVGMLVMSAESSKVVSAILNEDINFFQSIPGIGKKVAAKIILELKSKITGIDGEGVIGKMDGSNEVLDAMQSLGYKVHEISKLFSKIPQDCTETEDQIRWMIRNISK